MMDLSLITLKIITKIKKIKVNVRWTIFLVLEFSSSDFWFLLMPKISIQKEEVSAVIAPSAEGNSAEISPIMKTTPMRGDIFWNAKIGYKLHLKF